MSRLATLLDEYEESHRHPFNIMVHWIAEPLAIFALMSLTSSIPLPHGSLLWPFLALMLIYFAMLSIRVTLAFLPVVVMFWLLIGVVENTVPVETWMWSASLFGVCFAALLLGHRVEGRVPSVFQNPNLIFVGPVWLMRIVFRGLNWADP